MYKSIKELFTAIADELRERLDIDGKIPTQDMPQRVQDLYFTSFNNGRETGESVGYTRGYSEGEIKGREQGLTEGKEQGKSEVYSEIEPINAQLENTLNGTDTGGKSYYDEFWDMFQDYGKRVYYRFAFYRWVAEYIRPKYKVTTVDGDIQSIFSGASKLKKVEKEYFSFSPTSTNSNNYMFLGCTSLLIIEDIGLFASTYNYGTFQGCQLLHTIEVFRASKDSMFDSTFLHCFSLENLTIEGTIGQQGFNVQWSTTLSKASIISIINALSTTASGKSVTLSKVAVESAFGSTASEEWISLINTRSNWTINLV